MQDRKKTVSIITVNYNTGKILEDCIRSVFRYENPELFEIIVVDQNSKDNSQEITVSLSEEFGNIRYIFNDKNTGFAAGNNAGEKISGGDYILILNPDIIFTEPVLEKFTGYFEEKDTGAISPLLQGTDGYIQYGYYQKYPTIRQFIYFHSILTRFFEKNKTLRKKFHYDEDILKHKEGKVKVNQLPCAFFFTSKKIFRECGKMNEKYFLFFEDVDLSFRISGKYSLFTDCRSKVTHLGGASLNIDKNPDVFGNYILSMNIFFDCNYNFLLSFILKQVTFFNSFIIILTEYIKKTIKNRQDKFRFEKHKNFIKLFLKHYLRL